MSGVRFPQRPHMELQVGVKVLLKNAEGKYLLLRRSAQKYPEAARQWDIVGGRIEVGSDLLENLKREVKEETQLEIRDTPKLVAAQDIMPKDKHFVRLTYIGETTGTPILDEEHEEFGWFSLEEVRTLANLDKYVKELLDKGVIS